MNYKTKLSLVIFFIFIINGYSQKSKGSPEWLVESFFTQKKFPEKSKYYMGEMLQFYDSPTIGARTPDTIETKIRELQHIESQVIYAISQSDQNTTVDWYCIINQDNTKWKINAIRRLALSPFVYMIYDSLQKNQNLPDSLIFMKNNIELMIKSDAKLKQYLVDNLNTFENIISFINQNKEEDAKEKLKKLFLDSYYRDDRFSGCIFFLIGGIIDNSVGFIYSKDSAKIPVMSPNEYIYIEKIIGNWYIFKTT